MSKKIIFILFIITVAILYLVQTLTQRRYQTTAPILPSVTPNYPTSNSDEPSTTEFVLDWTNTIFDNPLSKYPVYRSGSFLSVDLAEQIAQKLGFPYESKQNLYGSYLWKTPDELHTLLYTPKEKAIHYQYQGKTTSQSPISSDNASILALNLISNLVPGQTFELSNLTYEINSDLQDIIVTKDNAEALRINIDQTIDGFPVIPHTLIDSSVAYITVNKDNKPSFITINDGFTDAKKTSTTQEFSTEKLKTSSIQNFINITPLRLEHGEIIKTSSTVNLIINKVSVAYININNTLSPVYLLETHLKPNNRVALPVTVKYIVPMR